MRSFGIQDDDDDEERRKKQENSSSPKMYWNSINITSLNSSTKSVVFQWEKNWTLLDVACKMGDKKIIKSNLDAFETTMQYVGIH